MQMQSKLGDLKTWKEDPVFVVLIWVIVLILAPVWVPLHIILRLFGRRGFVIKGYYEFPGWGYTWVIDLSLIGFKSIKSKITLKRTPDES